MDNEIFLLVNFFFYTFVFRLELFAKIKHCFEFSKHCIDFLREKNYYVIWC